MNELESVKRIRRNSSNSLDCSLEPGALELLIVFELELRCEADADPVLRLSDPDSYRSEARGQLPTFRHRRFVELGRARLGRGGVALVIPHLFNERTAFPSDLEGALLLLFFLVLFVELSLDAIEVAPPRAPLPVYLGRGLLLGFGERWLSTELLVVLALTVGLDQPRTFFLGFLLRLARILSLGERAARASEHNDEQDAS